METDRESLRRSVLRQKKMLTAFIRKPIQMHGLNIFHLTITGASSALISKNQARPTQHKKI